MSYETLNLVFSVVGHCGLILLQVVNRYVDEGVAELVPGVLFIDEVRFSFRQHRV